MITKKLAMFLGVAMMVAGGFAVTAKAQIPDQEILKADIPFPFMIRNKAFPAGVYQIRQIPWEDSEFVLEISSAKDKIKPEVFQTEGTKANTDPLYSNFVFDKVGNKYYLSKVFAQDSMDGNEVPQTRAVEKLLKREENTDHYQVRVARLDKTRKADRTGNSE